MKKIPVDLRMTKDMHKWYATLAKDAGVSFEQVLLVILAISIRAQKPKKPEDR